LSSAALKFGKKESKVYLFDWGTTSYIVAFELPRFFQFNFGEVEHFLSNYCMTYINDSNLNLDSLYFTYIENFNKVGAVMF
jgi:hypothetical protein